MESNSWSEVDIDYVSAQFHGLPQQQVEQEAETSLQIIDGDLRQAAAFPMFQAPQNVSIYTQDPPIPASMQNTAGGQAGVLNLRTMQWTPISMDQVATIEMLETVQQAGSADWNGANSPTTSTTDSFTSSNRAPAEQQQGEGQAQGLRMDRAALERVAQLALEELARREGQE